MRNHHKLIVFGLADRLAILVYRYTKSFPQAERYGLTAQLRRAAVSVAANIVEAAARPSRADYARLLAIAYGSARELEYEISIADRLGYFRAPEAAEVADLASQASRALRALVASMDRTSRSSGLGSSA
jgi:four helix bundle protein